MLNSLNIGIDLGSSTAKLVVLDNQFNLLYKEYKRHNGKIKQVIIDMIEKIAETYKNSKIKIAMTGSAGMGLAERSGLSFIQEVIAITKAIKALYPEVQTLIELGGEDAKVVLFEQGKTPEMRMNGSCAGGTGSFIDQMATLLNVSFEELNEMSKNSKKKLFIASRCGVFAKTDVQAHLNKGEHKEDIARAVFNAVANQAVSVLLGGVEVKPKVLFAGGPLTFLSELRRAFYEVLVMDKENFILPDNAEVLVAIGAGIYANSLKETLAVDELLQKLRSEKNTKRTIRSLGPLFNNEQEYNEFKNRHNKLSILKASDDEIKDSKEFYLGIDAGSTTTKLILINENNKIIDSYYSSNEGNPLKVAINALKLFQGHLKSGKLKAAYATGYGEEFMNIALNLDGGIVETIAHFTAGSEFNDNLTYILDIGGQDIKAIKIENNVIAEIKLNEACSSGTERFIETFAKSLGLSLEEFVNKALFAPNPVDLGTRCSVFMNSKVKEALKDGVSVEDISAGLAYSIIKNALYKVIEIKNIEVLGENIFVQGGTFKNDAVLRAFELLTGKNVYRLNISEYMGALGAALYAKKFYAENKGYKTKFDINRIDDISYTKKTLQCQGCGNKCSVTMFRFDNNNIFYTGNRCEKFFSNRSRANRITENFFLEKEDMTFEFKGLDIKFPKINRNLPKIGLIRALSMYEHYPFFYSFFRKLGFNVVLSERTTQETYLKGIRSISVDTVCLPAKVAHGHVIDLVDKNVDRIFYPIIIYERYEGDDPVNSYNCPIVTGYGEVLKHSIKTDIPIDTIPMSFRYQKGIRENLYNYVKKYGFTREDIARAIGFGFNVEKKVYENQVRRAKELISKAKAEGKPLIVVLGRPYHLDPFINQGILDMIYDQGAYGITENALPGLYDETLNGVLPLTQWSYHNRLYLAAKWVNNFDYDKVAILQLTSFGCGPDAVVVDEVKAIAESRGRIAVSIKIDEMSNLGASKIRIRSLLEALKQNNSFKVKRRIYTKTFINKEDKKKTLLVPYFAKVYSELMVPVFEHLGYKLEILNDQSKEAVEEGLKYVHNDMCYPAVIVIGDVIKALKDKRFDPDNVVVGLSQTGGQCRASNYVPLMKKALVDAGFYNTPVVSLSTDGTTEGLSLNPIKLLKYSGIIFSIADALWKMRLSTRPYEVNKGDTLNLLDKLLKELVNELMQKKPTRHILKKFMRKAIKRFNSIPVQKSKEKKIGIVGEIYLKSNCFSNEFIIDFLEKRGYEVSIPTFIKFLEFDYFSESYNNKNKIQRDLPALLKQSVVRYVLNHYRNNVEDELKHYKHYRPEKNLEHAISSNINPLPLYLQFGEGWLLSMEIVEMIEQGIKDIIVLQPFGCISNNIVAKGIYRLLRDKFDLNLLSLDFDGSTSQVNVLNRLELFLKTKDE